MENKEAAAAFSLRGWTHWEHIRDGKVIDVRDVPNAIVNVGKAQTAYMINNTNTGTYLPFTYIAIGIGTTAATATDTGLGSEIISYGGARAASTVSTVTTSVTYDTAQLTHTFTFTTSGTFAVTESAVFNSSTAGVALCRQTFAAINVVPADTLAVTWKVQVS